MTAPTVDRPDARDHAFLRVCVDLARGALDAGDEPFGSVLVDVEGTILRSDRNRVRGGDATQHPELALARWAAEHLDAEQRRTSTVYTSGEHCPMCSAAHAWVGLGRIVYAASGAQLAGWRERWGIPPGPVAPLPIHVVAPGIPVSGPDPELVGEVRALHARLLGVADR
ncbi:nucleoside deaminase [Oerskovia rustica]|uniref:Nucleoside deaminase n=1 Tax=Oerskovia rustica TaxID=2762237 RepID=A0ABR8RPF5_9CELL|nr:nucleoside deaminase [Oerskovia rustica]MBD7949342.1 nucleoside deaminase [Oerskovia rustica]